MNYNHLCVALRLIAIIDFDLFIGLMSGKLKYFSSVKLRILKFCLDMAPGWSLSLLLLALQNGRLKLRLPTKSLCCPLASPRLEAIFKVVCFIVWRPSFKSF